MWKLILELSIIFLVLILISQVMFPIIMSKPMFWLFRKSVTIEETKSEKRSFDEEVEFIKNEKEKSEELRLKIENEIKEKINKVNNLNNN